MRLKVHNVQICKRRLFVVLPPGRKYREMQWLLWLLHFSLPVTREIYCL